jgi:CBS domain-containing protein
MTPATKSPRRPSPLTARHIMSGDVVTVLPTCSLRACAATLRDNRITGAAVVTTAGKLIGVISETDLVERDAQPVVSSFIVRSAPDPAPGRTDAKGAAVAEPIEEPRESGTVADVFSPYVVTAGPDERLEDLAALMVRHRIHRLFIVDGQRLAGVVSSMDVMRAIASVRIASVRARAQERA